MKFFLNEILRKVLGSLAQSIIYKYEPMVIGITGSIGKTSAKEAVFCLLKNNFRVRENIKNYNNEIGLPLTILGEVSPGRNLFGWLGLFYRAIKLLLITDEKYPEILILEMGADKPGDMDELLKIAPADIGIITNIGPVHLEKFKTVERVAKEKSRLVAKLKPNGWGILCADNEQVLALKSIVSGRFLTYGFSPDSSVRALEPALSYKNGEVAGLSFKLSYDGKIVPVFLPGVLAEHLITAALAAACVGIVLKMNLLEISEALKGFHPPKGRMNLLSGVSDSRLIDDTYNASPEAVLAALSVLKKIETNGHKIAVLGDMLELGSYEQASHEQAGQAVSFVDQLVVVGQRAEIIAEAAEQAGLPSSHIKRFSASTEAGEWLAGQLKPGDLALFKGSQGMRMERAVKLCLAEPSQAGELLVRQNPEWLAKN